MAKQLNLCTEFIENVEYNTIKKRLSEIKKKLKKKYCIYSNELTVFDGDLFAGCSHEVASDEDIGAEVVALDVAYVELTLGLLTLGLSIGK